MRWSLVWEAIDTRRVELGWSKADLYRHTGISETTYRAMAGEDRPVSALAKRMRIVEALGWTADSIDRVLDGGAPVEINSERSELARIEALEDRLLTLRADFASQQDQLLALAQHLRAHELGSVSAVHQASHR